MLKVEADNADATAAIINRIIWYNGSVEAANAIPSANISTDAAGVITIIGLSPATTYSGLKAAIGSFVNDVPAFTTETETDVPNGDFSSGDDVRFEKIQIGGEFTGTIFSSPKYRHYANIVYKETNGWANLNGKTCYDGSNPNNTWFMVPSTFITGGAATIRTVGYNHNGTVPGVTKETAVWYCKNAPSESQLVMAAGELFLGSYEFSGNSENRTDGIDFVSRPSSLSFQYSYTVVSESVSEKGRVSVKLVDSDNKVLVENTKDLDASSSMVDVTIPLTVILSDVKQRS